MLRNGTLAPRFSLSSPKQEISLESLIGKPIILLFLRGKFCPTTARFLSAYQDFYGRMKDMGINLLAISTDSLEDSEFLSENFRLSFPLLSDPDFKVCELFHTYKDERKSGRVYSEPAVIIIDVEGKIAYSVISSGPKGLPSPGDLAPVLLYMHFHEGKY